mgnify:FL=1
MERSVQVKTVIFRTVRQQKYLSAGIFCAVAGAIILSLVPPAILARMIDMITGGGEASFLMLFLYVAALVAAGFLESVREGLLTVFGQKITHALRSALMEKLTALSSAEIGQQEPGALVSRFVGDVDTVENLFTSGIISMFADACRIVSILVVIWFQNRGLMLALSVILPFVFWFTRHVQKNMLTAQIENRRAVGRASNYVPETLHNIRTIHCLGKEAYMEKRYDQYISESYRAMERTNFYDAIYSPVILILNAVVVAAVMLLSASGNAQILTLFGMSAGTAVAVINYISQIFGPVESLGMEIQTIQSAVAGIHRIDEFFALEDKAKENTEEDAQAEPADVSGIPFVEFRNVTFGYGEHLVLDHVSFQVMEGEQVTLAGRTGAGKSTILKLLLGLYEPLSGEVLIRGIPASKIKEEERRKLFGCVEQSFHLVPGTVRDQITLFDPQIREEQVRTAAELTGLSETIERFKNGYDTVCTPELFSQGQWQLLSIARATAADPPLLLLDEITANLDAETEKTVLQALKRVAGNRTVISVSHRTSAKVGRIIEI